MSADAPTTEVACSPLLTNHLAVARLADLDAIMPNLPVSTKMKKCPKLKPLI